ncbi:MAG: hypothetical protein AB1650_04410 [Candidatus Omnitrophota bacterium]
MNETLTLIILIPTAIVFFTILFKSAKKIDKFQARVREYIEIKHPEVKIVGKLGFAFELQIDDKIYPVWLHPIYKQFKNKPDNFDNIIENCLLKLPFEAKSKKVK